MYNVVFSPNNPAGAAILGLTLGALSAVGPDHLCTLATLTVGGKRTFRAAIGTGISWSIGHTFGMVTVCIVAIAFQQLARVQAWSRYGDYLAGTFMVVLGAFFLASEEKYLQKARDGSYTAKPCCGGHHAIHMGHDHGHVHDHGRDTHGCNTCSNVGCADHHNEEAPLLGSVAVQQQGGCWDSRGICVGLLQGVCCPSCLLGLSFAGQFSSHMAPGNMYLSVCAFVVSLVVSSSVCTVIVLTGLLLTFQYASSCVTITVHHIYRLSASITLLMGVVWIALARSGHLSIMEFGEHVKFGQQIASEQVGLMQLSVVTN